MHTGLTHVEAAVHCIVEIINAFTLVDSSDSTVSQAVRLYLNLLLCPDMVVSFSAKQAFIRVLRPRLKRRCVFIPIPPHCSTPPHLGTSITKPPFINRLGNKLLHFHEKIYLHLFRFLYNMLKLPICKFK